jgi:hypothetical protein
MPTVEFEVEPGLLTEDEHLAMELSGKLAHTMRKIIGEGPMSWFDWIEAADKIHQLQRMVMAQASARAYPKLYRLLGETIDRDA